MVIVNLLIALDATTLDNVPAGKGPITMLRCAGTEPRVIDCSLSTAKYEYFCIHSRDVGVRCLTREPSTGVYLCMCGNI